MRFLVVTADDFGIGPATSQGILDLGRQGIVTATVLLVNSPYAEQAVRAWRQAARPVELGWHPCLTLDRPVLPVQRVPSLVTSDGRFRSLGGLVRALLLGRVRVEEIEDEFRAQYARFRELVGLAPSVVNSHHHVQVFEPVGTALRNVLAGEQPAPYLRRIREPWRTLWRVPGARRKRLLLSMLGNRSARRQEAVALPGNDWLAGITDPPWVADPRFLERWLAHIPGTVVELTCHPGHEDRTLIGRDCTETDGQLHRRVREFYLLQQPEFRAACRRAGFALISPTDLRELDAAAGEVHAA